MTKYTPGVISTRRRSIGYNLKGTASALRGLHENNLGGTALERDVDFLEDKEIEALKKIVKNMAACENSLRKLAKRLGLNEDELR